VGKFLEGLPARNVRNNSSFVGIVIEGMSIVVGNARPAVDPINVGATGSNIGKAKKVGETIAIGSERGGGGRY